jgi:hypothetical protein
MKTVTDSQGREWELRMMLLHWERLVANGLISNHLETQPADFQKLVCDPAHLARVTYCIVKEKANEYGYQSEADFMSTLPLSDMGLLGEAVIEELHDFFVLLRMSLQAFILRTIRDELATKLKELEGQLQALRGNAPA